MKQAERYLPNHDERYPSSTAHATGEFPAPPQGPPFQLPRPMTRGAWEVTLAAESPGLKPILLRALFAGVKAHASACMPDRETCDPSPPKLPRMRLLS